MGIRDQTSGKHGTRSSTTIYEASNQGSCNSVAIECQNSQIQRTISRSEINYFIPDGPAQVLVCKHMRGYLCQVVRISEDPSTLLEP
jgi:hypothetical protein